MILFDVIDFKTHDRLIRMFTCWEFSIINGFDKVNNLFWLLTVQLKSYGIHPMTHSFLITDKSSSLWLINENCLFSPINLKWNKKFSNALNWFWFMTKKAIFDSWNIHNLIDMTSNFQLFLLTIVPILRNCNFRAKQRWWTMHWVTFCKRSFGAR